MLAIAAVVLLVGISIGLFVFFLKVYMRETRDNMTQYRIVKRSNKESITTFVIQKYAWFTWKDLVINTTYRSLLEAKKALDTICYTPPADEVVYNCWK